MKILKQFKISSHQATHDDTVVRVTAGLIDTYEEIQFEVSPETARAFPVGTPLNIEIGDDDE